MPWSYEDPDIFWHIVHVYKDLFLGMFYCRLQIKESLGITVCFRLYAVWEVYTCVSCLMLCGTCFYSVPVCSLWAIFMVSSCLILKLLFRPGLIIQNAGSQMFPGHSFIKYRVTDLPRALGMTVSILHRAFTGGALHFHLKKMGYVFIHNHGPHPKLSLIPQWWCTNHSSSPPLLKKKRLCICISWWKIYNDVCLQSKCDFSSF